MYTWLLNTVGQVDVEETFWRGAFQSTNGTAYLDPKVKDSFQYTTGGLSAGPTQWQATSPWHNLVVLASGCICYGACSISSEVLHIP
jgi:hypothetical protein